MTPGEFFMNVKLPDDLGEISWGPFKLRGDRESILEVERLLKLEIELEILKRERRLAAH
jgi:hypothetical protein